MEAVARAVRVNLTDMSSSSSSESSSSASSSSGGTSSSGVGSGSSGGGGGKKSSLGGGGSSSSGGGGGTKSSISSPAIQAQATVVPSFSESYSLMSLPSSVLAILYQKHYSPGGAEAS